MRSNSESDFIIVFRGFNLCENIINLGNWLFWTKFAVFFSCWTWIRKLRYACFSPNSDTLNTNSVFVFHSNLSFAFGPLTPLPPMCSYQLFDNYVPLPRNLIRNFTLKNFISTYFSRISHYFGEKRFFEHFLSFWKKGQILKNKIEKNF